MEFRHSTSVPHSPTDIGPNSGSSRIKIDALLNPSGTDTRCSSPYPSPTFDSYNHHAQLHHHQPYTQQHQQQQQRSYSHVYQPPQFQPIQYITHSHSASPIDPRSDPLDRRHTSSTSSSPAPYRRDRFPSVSSGSSTHTHTNSNTHSTHSHSSNSHSIRRAPRPKYDEEEMYFIWYHRVDLRQEWKQVRESFNAQFPDRQRSGFQGIQCKYYRFIKEKNCPTLREQRRKRSTGSSSGGGSVSEGTVKRGDSPSHGGGNGENLAYGVVRWTGVRFPWMKEHPPSP